MNTPKGDSEEGNGLTLALNDGKTSVITTVQTGHETSASPGRDVHTSYPTAKVQYKFNQKLFWLLLKLIAVQDIESQEVLSKDLNDLVDIQSELREILQSSPTTAREENV